MADVVTLLADDYVSYALATLNRALPSAIDGLKVSHRRILQTGLEHGYTGLVKTSRWSGMTMGTLHPHGDSSGTIYSLVDKSTYRYPLITGNGNFGGVAWESGHRISPDGPAAARYTEVALSDFAQHIFDIDAGLLSRRPSYDNKQQEVASYVPAVPILAIAGATGIATGYATTCLPFNFGSIAKVLLKHLANGRPLSVLCRDLVPDWSSGCRVLNDHGLEAYLATGRGTIRIRGNWSIAKQKRRDTITITELPFCNAETYCYKIREAIKSGKVSGISDVQDLSAKTIEVKVLCQSGISAESVLAQLLAHTPLEDTISGNNTVLNKGLPELMPVSGILKQWLIARREVLIAKYTKQSNALSLAKHKLQGLAKAIAMLDELIAIIRKSATKQSAKQKLVAEYGFSEAQAEAVLNMALAKLVNSEALAIQTEISSIEAQIAELSRLIAEPDKAIAKQLKELSKAYALPSKTKLVDSFVVAKAVAIAKPKQKTALQKMLEQGSSLEPVAMTKTSIRQFAKQDKHNDPELAKLSMADAWAQRMAKHVAYWNGKKGTEHKVPANCLVATLAVVDPKELTALNAWCKKSGYPRFDRKTLSQKLTKYGDIVGVKQAHARFWKNRA